MRKQNTTTPLTETRIKQILELEPELLRRTKKDKRKYLRVPYLPDLKRGETLMDVISPQMAQYFSSWDEDPARYFKDRDRMLMIFTAIKAGGAHVLIKRYNQLATGELLNTAISNMKEKDFGNPSAVAEMLPQMIRNAEDMVRRLQSISSDEEEAVKNCLKEIENSIFRRGKK